MTREEIDQRVRTVVARQLTVDASALTPETRFAEDLDADSLDVTELVLALEDELGVELPESEMGDVHTIGEAVELISTKLA